MTGLMGQQLAIQDCRTEADALGVASLGVASWQAARSQAARGEDTRRRAILTRTVELDVIPRLLFAHPPQILPRTVDLVVTAGHVADLVALLLARSEPEAVAFVGAVHERGVEAEAIYLDLLAPAARRLGEMWENDTCAFTDVTVGLWHLQNAMRKLSPSFLCAARPDGRGPRVLLLPLPGETHTFGLSMVYEFFRRAGWNAWTGSVDCSADLRSLVRREWVEIVGFSLACDDKLDAVRAEIRSVRRASKNPALHVLVGGPGFAANPLLAAQVGADGTAVNGREAVLQAQALVDLAAKRR